MRALGPAPPPSPPPLAENAPGVAGEAGAQEGIERGGGHKELMQAAVQPGGRHGVGGIGEGAAWGAGGGERGGS